ncbi:MAG TPA: phenylacetate--CoA ligase, partial [Roseiflexaceae bacterium]|nr:phenylacetate--CoA ligase [Roseiflexaceae bacterium]
MGRFEPYIWNPVEALPRNELERLQTERLRACVERVVANVPFYRERLAGSGISAADIRSIGDLARLPFTTKQDLRDNYPYDLLAVPMEQVVRVHASSGTTGKLTVVGYTSVDLALWANMIARALAAGGMRPS